MMKPTQLVILLYLLQILFAIFNARNKIKYLNVTYRYNIWTSICCSFLTVAFLLMNAQLSQDRQPALYLELVLFLNFNAWFISYLYAPIKNKQNSQSELQTYSRNIQDKERERKDIL